MFQGRWTRFALDFTGIFMVFNPSRPQRKLRLDMQLSILWEEEEEKRQIVYVSVIYDMFTNLIAKSSTQCWFYLWEETKKLQSQPELSQIWWPLLLMFELVSH